MTKYTHWREIGFRQLAVVMALVMVLTGAACSNPIDSDDEEAGDATNTEEVGDGDQLDPLPIVTPTQGDPDAEPSPTEANEEPVEVPDSYVVEDGDSLYSIAARFGVEIAALVDANDLSDPNDIQSGQELVIPQGED